MVQLDFLHSLLSRSWTWLASPVGQLLFTLGFTLFLEISWLWNGPKCQQQSFSLMYKYLKDTTKIHNKSPDGLTSSSATLTDLIMWLGKQNYQQITQAPIWCSRTFKWPLCFKTAKISPVFANIYQLPENIWVHLWPLEINDLSSVLTGFHMALNLDNQPSSLPRPVSDKCGPKGPFIFDPRGPYSTQFLK